MLIIREEQMQAFADNSLRSFEERALTYLKDEYPGEYEQRGEDGMRQFLRQTRERAKEREIDSEAGIIACTELSFVYNENFYENEEWAVYIFSAEELEPETKVERLKGYLGKTETVEK